MASIYDGELVNGAVIPSWASIADHSTQPTNLAGVATIVTSKVTGSGTATNGPFVNTTHFSWQQLKPPLATAQIAGQDRAEYQGNKFSWAAYENTIQAMSFAVYLPSAGNWTSAWAASATSVHNHPVLIQPWARGVQNGLIHLHPAGNQGTTAPSITWWGEGGQIVSGAGSYRMAMATDWHTFLAPTSSAALNSNRFPQIAGPNTQTGVSFPLVYDTWMEFILIQLLTTTGGNGFYQAWAQVYGSGVPWVKVLDSPANYNTVSWSPTGGLAPAHADGSIDYHRFGGYVYNLPAEIDYGVGGFHTFSGASAAAALASAQAVFHAETSAGAPVNTVAPTVSGLAPVGSTLTVTNGSWTNSPTSFTRQWTKDGTNIVAATGATYVTVGGDATHAIGCKVVAINATGSSAAQASSNTITPAAGGTAPANTVPPLITGTTKVGSVLTVTNGTWTGTATITFTRQWKNASGNLAGATGSTYTLLDSDDVSTIHCTVLATNGSGSVSADSNSVAITEPIPVNSSAPTIVESDPLVLSAPGTWSSMGGAAGSSFGYQWTRDGLPVSSATSDTYTITPLDYFHSLAILVSATNSGGTAAAVSSNVIDPVQPPSFVDTAADVPGKYDVVIDGFGYVFWNALMQSLPFRNQRAAYYYYPTFLERTNVSGAYGDDTQSFWLTATQNDWSEGAGRRYFRSADADLIRRYWESDSVDVSGIPGQVTLGPSLSDSIGYGEATYGACSSEGVDGNIYSVSTTDLHWITTNSITSGYLLSGAGAHGCGAAPELWGMAHDGLNLFISSTKVGTVGVRKWDTSNFTTFSAQPADSLAFLNNTLFGYEKATSTLYTYDTAGTAIASFTWKAADGTAPDSRGQLCPFGGQLLILRYGKVTELWQYDGTGVAIQTDFPDDFIGYEIKVVSGIVFISGLVNQGGNYYPHIFYFVNGTLGQLWQATSSTLTDVNQYPTMAAYNSGMAFTDDTTGSVFQYDIAFGGVHQIGTTTVSTDPPTMAASPNLLVITRNRNSVSQYPDLVKISSGSITTSLFDFENSLLKVPRGIKVEFDTDADSSVDIAYQYDSVDGAFTTLQTGATSGVEYVLPTTQCHSIAVQVTLNLNSSLVGPTLKRIFVRAAPLLTTYRRVEYDLDLTGATSVGGVMENAVPLRNGNFMPRTGRQQAANLQASMISQIPIVITDSFGTFTAVFEQGPEVSEFDEVRPGEYIAKVTLREV